MEVPVEGVNPKVLKDCRDQLGLELSEVEESIPGISDIERGNFRPSFDQINALAELYDVPRWIFISDELPREFRRKERMRADFSKFSSSGRNVLNDPKIRILITRVERYRDLILELSEDIKEPLPRFKSPDSASDNHIKIQAERVRDWLGMGDDSRSFSEWRKSIENRGIFVFLSSECKDSLFRGISIFHDILPTIVINDFDPGEAQLFTLLHELGHILHKENSLDYWYPQGKPEELREEEWCDNFAGGLLMPEASFREHSKAFSNYSSIKELAGQYKVSPFVILIRLKQLGIITREKDYRNLEKSIHAERSKLREKEEAASDEQAKDVIRRFGETYIRILFHSYYEKEINMHKLMKLFEVKSPALLLDIEASI